MKLKRIFIVILMLSVFLSGCQEVAEINIIRNDCELEVLKFINTMLSKCNEYKDGKSVLTFGEMQLRLDLAKKAAEIYERINNH